MTRRLSTVRGWWVAGVVLAVGGCRGCDSGPGPTDLRDWMPLNTSHAMVIPEIGTFMTGVNAYAESLFRPDATLWTRFVAGVTEQLGASPFTREGLDTLGLDPRQGLAVYGATTASPVVMVGVGDRERFDAALMRVVEKLDGAHRVETRRRDGLTYRVLGRPFGTEVVPAFAWAHVPPVAVITRGTDAPTLEAAARYAQIQSRAEEPIVVHALAPLDEPAASLPGGDVTFFTHRPPPALSAVARLHFGDDGFRWDARLEEPTDLGPLTAGDPVAPLVEVLAPDALVVVASRGATAASMTAVKTRPVWANTLTRFLRRAQTEAGLDFENEVMALLEGSVVAALHPAPTPLPSLPRHHRGMASTALRWLHGVLVARLNDGPAMEERLTQGRERLAERGVAVRTRKVSVNGGPVTVYEPDQPQPRLGWAIVGDRYLYAAGPGRLDRALDQLTAGSSAFGSGLPNPVTQALKTSNTAVALVRGTALAEHLGQVAGAPAGASGLGAVLDGAVQALRNMGDAVFTLTGDDHGLRMTGRHGFSKP